MSFGRLSQSYESLVEAAATSTPLFRHLPLVTVHAPLDYYREIAVLESLTIAETPEQRDAHAPVPEGALVLPHVDTMLADFDPELGRLLVGARRSLTSENPDRTRHVTTSLRELITHVLHTLAPDRLVREWATSEEMLHNGRPTRRCRLRYICRSTDSDPLTEFVENDVRTTESLLDALHKGTHVVASQLTPAQLEAIVARTESLLVFLLQVAHERRS